ncbi:MAG: nucleotidyltransferase [Candidatus Baltobacteraceae bacterium]
MESLRSSDDFKNLLSLFNAENVRYLVIGGFALAHFGHPRYTKDLDLWVDPEGDNPERVFRALARFGAALEGVSPNDFRDADTVFQIGVEPLRIDLLNDISGVTFGDAWEHRTSADYGGVPVTVIGHDDYVSNKLASGRASDLRDVETLREAEET